MNIQRIKEMFAQNQFTCILSNGDTTYTSTLTGISPMVEFLSQGIHLEGYFAADKIVGKAAALLFALAGVHGIYAPVMSKDAVDIFSRFSIQYEYDELTNMIINRAGDGPCPMEQTVAQIEDPNEAFEAIKQTLKRLRSEKKQ